MLCTPGMAGNKLVRFVPVDSVGRVIIGAVFCLLNMVVPKMELMPGALDVIVRLFPVPLEGSMNGC